MRQVMTPWVANAAGLAFAAGGTTLAALALLWRIGSWQVHPAALLTLDEGLAIGARAPELAGAIAEQDVHLTWGGRLTFLVFGTRGCKPCEELLQIAPRHPATRHMRLVYMADHLDDPLLATHGRWERYVFHDEMFQRKAWRAPVSPYFHVIGTNGRIVAKGLANDDRHLDRLLELLPPEISPAILLPTPSS
jgi:hypothetical protein